MERFGEFLVQRGVISSEQLLDALAYSTYMARNLSLMAMMEDLLSDEEMERIVARRIETGDSFEASLVQLQIISEERIQELRKSGEDYQVPLEEILRRRDVLSHRELLHWRKVHETVGDERTELLELLRKIDFFGALKGEVLEKIVSGSEPRTWAAGESIYREGDASDAVYLIQAGLVRLSAGTGSDLFELGVIQSAEHLGLSAVLNGDDRIESATAVTRSRIWRIDAGAMREILLGDPEVATEIASRVGADLRKIARGVRDRVRAFDNNLYALIMEAGLARRELITEFIAALAREMTGTIQLIHNSPEHGPDVFSLEGIVKQADENRIHVLGIPGLHPDRDFDRILKWLHGETQGVSNLVFLIALPPADAATRGESERTAELILTNSRRALILSDGRPAGYLERLRPSQDRVQLVQQEKQLNRERFATLKRIAGDCLAPITFKPDRMSSSAGKAVRILLGNEIGIVLGGGGAKCAAHIGVLQVLAESGIKVDVMAASSSGNLIAALWARGMSMDDLTQAYMDEFGRKKVRFPDWTLPIRGYLANGNTGKKYLRRFMGDRYTFDCEHAYLPIAVDMNRGRDIVVRGCETWRASFASGAIPGLMPLVEHEGALLADAALANNVPSSHVRAYGAELIISVNISPVPEHTNFNPRSVAGNMLRSVEVMMHQTTSRHMEFTDLEIRPEVGTYGMFEFSLSEKFIELGRRAAEAKLPELRVLLGT